MEMTSEICARKLVSPSTRNFGISLPFSRKLPFSNFMTFMCRRYHMESAAVNTCPITVATAAPIMPQRKP